MKRSLSTFQSIVAVLAGITSIAGATWSAVATWRTDAQIGEVVAIVRRARDGAPARNAIVELHTADDATVAAVPVDDDGIARREVAPGAYQLRVRHPAYADATRDVHVEAGRLAAVDVALEPHAHATSAPVTTADATPHDATQPTATSPSRAASHVSRAERALDRGATATRRFFNRLGF